MRAGECDGRGCEETLKENPYFRDELSQVWAAIDPERSVIASTQEISRIYVFCILYFVGKHNCL